MKKYRRSTKGLAALLVAALTLTSVETQGISAYAQEADGGITMEAKTQSADMAVSADVISKNQASDSSETDNEVSDNQISADIIEVEEVSENTVSGDAAELAAIGKAAREALHKLVMEKEIMALVYLSDEVYIKQEPSEESETVCSVKSGTTVLIEDFAVSDNTMWYRVKVAEDGDGSLGYVKRANLAYSDERFLAWEEEWIPKLNVIEAEAQTGGSYADIEQFPQSYQAALTSLKNSHSNWVFVPYNSGIDWNSAVTAQQGERSYISYTASDEYKNGATGQANWYYASKKAIEYYMDPRNSLTEDYIFQHEQLTYNSSYHTKDAVQAVLNNTFMSGAIPGDSQTYANAFFNIGSSINMSPIHLAARVRQEQGVDGTSALISGTYSGYTGYYNYFNIKASGSTTAEVIANGLAYAKSQGWNTRYKALLGGAQFLNNGYVSVGQDTLYLEKFDLVGTPYTHQYMQNIMAPFTEGKSTKTGYSNAGVLNKAYVFKIPVYSGMPASLSLDKSSMKINKGKTYTFSVYDSGSKISNSAVSWSSSDSSVASITQAGVLTAKEIGSTKITITNSSGDKATCTVNVICKLEKITLNKTSVSMERADTVKLDVSYDPAETTDDKTVTWKTSNKNVASITNKANGDGINDTCTIVAGAPGSATITATVGELTATCKITVNAYLTSVSLNKSEATIFAGDTERLTLMYEPLFTSDDTTITWTSGNPSVATVENGVVKGIQNGTARITASMTSENGKTFSDICKVTVENCTVTYYDTQDVLLSSAEKSYGAVLGEFPAVFKAGNYEFAGWYTMKNGAGTHYTEDSIVKGDLYLYPYFMENDKGFFVKPIGDQSYTGSAIKPEVEVYDKTTLLKKGVDYKVSYQYNRKINDTSVTTKTPTVTVTGKGNYSGVETVSFNIVQTDLHDSSVAAKDILVAYNGSVKTPVPVIMQGTKKLVKNTDFTLSYSRSSEEGAYIQPGVYPIVVTGIGNYKGTITVNAVITKKVLASSLNVVKIADRAYTGDEQKPELTVKYKGNYLKAGTDYTVSYTSNVEIGTATAVLTGIEKAGYIGTKTVTFKITGQDIRKSTVYGVKDLVYDNRNAQGMVQNEYVLYGADGLGKLTEGKDYTVSYLNNQKAGTATIIFQGIGNFNKKQKVTYKIKKAELGDTMSAALSVPYEKGGAKPEPVVSMNGIVLSKGTDYTVKYSNNKKVGSGAVMTITGKGNYRGSFDRSFEITEKSFAAVEVTALDGIFNEKPGKFFVKPVITDSNGKKLQAGTDYEAEPVYTYVNDVAMADGSGAKKAAGSIAEKTDVPPAEAVILITVKGMGNYSTDTRTVSYRLARANIARAKVTVAAQTYTGSAITVSSADISAVLAGAPLSSSDYEIVTDSYQNNQNKGKAVVLIKGAGNYGGQKEITFRILPKVLVWWWNLLR